MKVLVSADCHVDHWRRAGTNPFGGADVLETLDALILAGDLADDPARSWPQIFGDLAGMIDPGKIWVVPGNHDYYGWRLDDDAGLRKIAGRAGVTFAQKQVIEIGGDRFLCATLWTDFGLFGANRFVEAMRAAMMVMPDYDQITVGPGRRPLKPANLLDRHRDHLTWLEAELARPCPGRTFVVTHHGPHPGAALPIGIGSAAFVSDLTGIIMRHQPDAWLFGHTHRWQGTRISRTVIRNVSLGYPDEVEPAHERALLLRGLIEHGALTGARP